HRLSRRRLRGLFYFFLNAFLFFLLLIRVQFFAVLLYFSIDLMAVHEEDVVFFGLVLFDVSILIEFVRDDGFMVGVVFAHLVEFVLMIFDLLHECGHVRQRRLRGLCERDGRREGRRDQQKAKLHKTSLSGYAGTVTVVPCSRDVQQSKKRGNRE